MKQLFAVTTAAAFFGMALTAQADEQGALDQMRHFAPYQQAIAKTYQDYESSLSTHCSSIKLDTADARASVVTPLQLDASGRISSGIWTEQTPGVACGEKRRYSAVVIFKDGAPSIYPLFPGDSNASPVLQHDAMLQVASAMAIAGASCPPEVIDTSLPNGAPKSAGVAWDEKWTVQSCGKRYLVPMHFVPDSTGTTVHINGNELVKLPAGKG